MFVYQIWYLKTIPTIFNINDKNAIQIVSLLNNWYILTLNVNNGKLDNLSFLFNVVSQFNLVNW